ncbi:MAG: LuxR C-terminal-related transcriptional regulator [Limisphaerales bacterium]
MEPPSAVASRPFRVVLLEDDRRFASELRAFLRDSPDFDCRAACETVDQAVEATQRLKPTAVLADMQLQGTFRPDAIRLIKRAWKSATVLVLTAYEEPELLFRALRAGADGYLLKSDSTRPLLDALRSAIADVPPFSPRVARHILRHFRAEDSEYARSGLSTLTARQTQVLKLVHEGFTNPEIARKLGITPDAVKMHIRGILDRLQVESRIEAATAYERFRHLGTSRSP